MLSDQTFRPKEIIVLATDFFLAPDRLDLDYQLVLEFRLFSENFLTRYDFHLWDLDTSEVHRRIEILDAWGCPVQLGKLFPVVPTRESKREIDRMIFTVSFLWARELCHTYRISGRKECSTISSELFLLALVSSMANPNPYSFREYLNRVQLTGSGI